MRSKNRKTYILDKFLELPDELKKRVVRAGISPQEAQANLEPLLNILHFKTKQNFYTTQMYEQKNKAKLRRHNKGPSLVVPGLISVTSLQEEQDELLTDFKKQNLKLISQIGKGGFGKVFLAKSTENDTKVAIKRMPHETTKQKRKNFQEIRFLRYCSGHSNILNLYKASLVKDELWLTTELLDGGTLTQAVAVHQFEEPEIAYVAKEILNALAFLHKNQMAHRDLKSANIMLTLDGIVKLIDFGLCSDISQGRVVHMVGSPFWMPPEMILRQPHGLPVDVWSYGVCLMEMANGHPPNRKSSIKAMFVAATTGYTSPLEDGAEMDISEEEEKEREKKDEKKKKRREAVWSDLFKEFVGMCLKVDPDARADVPTLQQHGFLSKTADQKDVAALFRKLFDQPKLGNGM